MADPVSAATSLVTTSVMLLDRVCGFFKKYAKVKIDVTSLSSDMRYIKDAIKQRSQTADRDGISSWIYDLRRIKLRIEDAVEFYHLKVAGRTASFEGFLGEPFHKGHTLRGDGGTLIEYLNEITELIKQAKRNVDLYLPELKSHLEKPLSDQTTNGDDDGDDDNYHHHPKVADPVGLETQTSELVQMLSDKTLKVVAISCPHGSRNSVLAEQVYNQVKGEFECKAWIMASQEGEKKLLQDILDQLITTPQLPQTIIELREILRKELLRKRYIVGINGLDTTDFWNDMVYAFPDDHKSSRIFVITTSEGIAQACRKNCTLYSLEARKADLVQMLSRDGQLRLVSICGRGGCGKSILADQAYQRVEEDFECSAWSRKSRNNSVELLRDILDKLDAPETRSEDAVELGDELRKFLTGKKYIIVIDGLETAAYWRDVRYACPDDNTSSRIIVTTTSKKVASICSGNSSVYMMQQALDKDSAQRLLAKEVYGNDGCSDKLREDLTNVLETCEYLPLAIADIGIYMRGEGANNIEWDNKQCEELSIKFGSLLVDKMEKSFRGMRHVFNRSYTSLNDNAKACLLSLRSYPIDLAFEKGIIEDHVIKVKPLIRRLLAERLISSSDDPTNGCVAPSDDLVNHCLTPLVELSFIVPRRYSISGRLKTFRVNRMLSQFIKEKGDQENYLTRIDIHRGRVVNSQYDITRLYLYNDSSSESGIGEEVDLTRVRLLTFHGVATEALLDFNGYTFLRVLVLENCSDIKNDKIHTVCSLSMLKYLSIRGNNGVSNLPHNIVKMQSLETLDIRDTMVDELLMKVVLLPKLANLFGKFKITCTRNDLKLVKGRTWQTLAGFFAYESPYFAKLLLPHMLKLTSKIKIICRQTAPIHGVEADIKQSLNECFKCNSSESRLRSLTFDFGVCDLDFLTNISDVPSSLLSLKLRGKLTKLPTWISSCNSLTELVLLGSNIERLSELHGLEKLLYLKLTEESTTGSSHCQAEYTWDNGWFKSLTRLHLDFLKLPKIVMKEEAMENLHSLQLCCTEFGGFDGIMNLHHLEEFIFDSESKSDEAYNLWNEVKMHPRRPRILGSGFEWQKLGTYRRFPRPPRAL